MRSPDRCPGVLRPHLAADGALVRIRVPGGQTTGPALRAVAELATRFGSGLVQLTSRAGLQLRGLADPVPAAVEHGLATAGFLPAPAHERVRNVVASPLTGLAGGLADLRGLVAELDHGLRADPVLADLPGRFLFGLDDGRGDIVPLGADLCYRAEDADRGVLLVGGPDRGLAVTSAEAVPRLLGLAREFLATADGAWRIADRPGFAETFPRAVPRPVSDGIPLGRIGRHASALVPLGLLTPDVLAAVGDVAGEGPVVLTPWRGLVLPGAADRLERLVTAGLVVTDDSGWRGLTACVGGPWCAQAHGSTHDLARRLAAGDRPAGRVHVSGCARRCGAPTTPYADLLVAGVPA